MTMQSEVGVHLLGVEGTLPLRLAAGLEEVAAGLLGGAAPPVLLLRPAVPFTALAGDLHSSMPCVSPASLLLVAGPAQKSSMPS